LPPLLLTRVHDPQLVALVEKAQAAASTPTRAKHYRTAGEHRSTRAYGPFPFRIASWSIAAKGVSRPGLTTEPPVADAVPGILWQDVSVRS
jgi:hypothetical protein